MPLALDSFFERYLPPLEDEMLQVLSAFETLPFGGLLGMLRYHLGWADEHFRPVRTSAGKRARPVLCLLVCEACGGDWQAALPAGAAVEMIHNFSLIHDDIEDNDRTRRGRPTVWTLWGQPQAINAGDTLFALAYLALLRLSEHDVSPESVVEATQIIGQTCVQLTGGQYLDMAFETRAEVSVEEYLAMVKGKTAALIACASELGALVAGVSQDQREHLRAFGHYLGMTFQMTDDILGIWGDPALTGKPVGSDIIRCKKTLPILYGLEQEPALGTLLAQGELSEQDVERATQLLLEAGSREYTERLAREYHDCAIAALEVTGLDTPTADVLRELAQVLLERQK